MSSPAAFDELVPLGWDHRVANLFHSVAAPGLSPARVARVDRGRCLVATADGATVAATARDLPAVGDWVVLDAGDRVHAILPRRSALSRQGQVMAANVDIVLVLAALDRPLNLNRLERELVAAWDSGARPLVVLTKVDEAVDENRDAPARLATRAVGVEVAVTSARTGEGVGTIARHLLPHRTAVMLGASGVGKSTLANALLGRDLQQTREVRPTDGRGRHATTARHLLVVPTGGVLVDTPGIRSLALGGDVDEGLASTFPDIEELAAGCRFRDCRHAGEPGCAVVPAVEPRRLASYAKLQREVEHAARSGDPRAQAEHERMWRSVHKAMRDSPQR